VTQLESNSNIYLLKMTTAFSAFSQAKYKSFM
jgi:hypothetical protein